MSFLRRSLPRLSVVLAALVFGGLYLFTALPRVVYPYDLDFDEDSMLMESLRFAQHQPVFLPPNAVFVPHVYMALYQVLGGLLLQLTGPSLTPLRLLSLTAVVATAALIYSIARRESGTRWLALACTGLYLGGYRISGFWYELVRVDSLFVALALAGLALGFYAGGSRGKLVLAAVFLASGFWTKQVCLVYGVGLAVYLLMTKRRRAGWFVLPWLALMSLPVLALNAATDGWFVYHTFFLLVRNNPSEIGRLLHFLGSELFGLMVPLTLMGLAALYFALRRTHPGLQAGAAAASVTAQSVQLWRGRLLELIRAQPWLLAFGMGVAVSAVGRTSVGGNLNNLMSAYTFLCLAPALLLKASRADAGSTLSGEGQVRVSAPPLRFQWEWVIAGAILVQFAIDAYNPLRYIPTAEMRQSGDRLVERIASIQGQVLVMMHPYYGLLAGKEPAAQLVTIWYIYARGEMPLPADFVSRLQAHYYAAIISDESSFETEPGIHDLVEANYAVSEILDMRDAPPTNTGVIVRPMLVYRPRP